MQIIHYHEVGVMVDTSCHMRRIDSNKCTYKSCHCGRHLEVTRNMVMLSSTMSTRDEQGTGERGLSAVVECSGMLFFSPNLLAVC